MFYCNFALWHSTQRVHLQALGRTGMPIPEAVGDTVVVSRDVDYVGSLAKSLSQDCAIRIVPCNWRKTQGGWAANQMRATARGALARSRWSLIFVKS